MNGKKIDWLNFFVWVNIIIWDIVLWVFIVLGIVKAIETFK